MLGLLVVPCLLGACARDAPHRWIRIAETAGRAESRARPSAAGFLLGGRRVRLVGDERGFWLETGIERADWKLHRRMGLWKAVVPLRGMGRPPEGVPPHRLLRPGGEFEPFLPRALLGMDDPPEGSFYLSGGLLYLKLSSGEEPPAHADLRLFVERHAPLRGAQRFRGSRFSGEGLLVWPGERVEWSGDLPPRSALSVTTCAESFRLEDEGSEGGGERVRFEVRLDGEVILEHEQDVSVAGTSSVHTIPLPPAGRPGARLAFTVEGPPAFSAFLAPVIGPAEAGSYAKRPWRRSRADIVCFQADTFRADNLGAYGSTLGITPFLDGLAARSLVFRDVHSVSTSTLPVHATLFAGLYPQQAGVADPGFGLSEDVVTIAERLAEAGYRTGAITDSVMVSTRFGFERGFEWFDERYDPIQGTFERARAFLDADDGRPVFLFVQSYRAHTPYEVGPATRAALGAKLGIEGDFLDLYDRFRHLTTGGHLSAAEIAEARGIAGELRAHYLGGIAELDGELAGFHRELQRRGLLGEGYFVFLSDHGEAFGEHDEMYHGGGVWEELTRVPLFLSGPRIRPGVVDHPASLVDLCPTLADMAGIPPCGEWVGTSLLSLDADRAILALQCRLSSPTSTVAVIEGRRKVMALEDPDAIENGEIFAAFDLGSDPAEAHDLREEGLAWPAEELARHRDFLRALLAPARGGPAPRLTADELEELGAMGYGGG